MDVSFIAREKDSWELMINGEETILTPIKKKLVMDETVSFAGTNRAHPQLEGVKLVIKGKNVEASFKKAVKELEGELKELGKLF